MQLMGEHMIQQAQVQAIAARLRRFPAGRLDLFLFALSAEGAAATAYYAVVGSTGPSADSGG